MVGDFHMLEFVGHDQPMVHVEEFGRGMAHGKHLVALFDDELELRHAQPLWDRSFCGGLELGHEEVDVTLSPCRHHWALVMVAHVWSLVLDGVVVDVAHLSRLEQNLRCHGDGVDGDGIATRNATRGERTRMKQHWS